MAVVRHIAALGGTVRDIACANPLSIGGGAHPVQFDGSAAVSLVPGTNVTMTNNNGVVTIDAEGGGASGGYPLMLMWSTPYNDDSSLTRYFDYAFVIERSDNLGTVTIRSTNKGSGPTRFEVGNSAVEIAKALSLQNNGGVSNRLVFEHCTKVTMKITRSRSDGSVNVNGTVYNWSQKESGDDAIVVFSVPLTGITIVGTNMVNCLPPDAVIAAPGGDKLLKDFRVGDVVWSVDGDGRLCEDTVSFCDSSEEKYGDETDVWTFDDGTVLRTIHPHEFYSADERRFKYIADFHVGERIVLFDGRTPALADHKVVPGRARHMTMFTERCNTYFADGALAGNRSSVKIPEVML